MRWLLGLSAGLVVVLYGCCCVGSTSTVVISNVVPRTDDAGVIMDVHDGNVLQWPLPSSGVSEYTYYRYGAGYGLCKESLWGCAGDFDLAEGCGFLTNHTIGIFQSNDLSNWHFVGEALPFEQRPEGIYFRPKVVYNAATKLFVLWVNFVGKKLKPDFFNSTYITATSTTPAGPFVIQNNDVKTRYGNPGDFALLVDDDGSAYIAYDAYNNRHTVSIEKLNSDYLSSKGALFNSGEIGESGNEAPALIKYSGWYYLLFGSVCCFCNVGGNAAVWVAQDPLEPWEYSGNDINPEITVEHNVTSHVIPAQQNGFIKITGYEEDQSKITWVWTGDLWGSAPDGLKGHDFQYWQPVTFDDSVVPPKLSMLSWVDEFTIDVA
ncbi:glycosyl family 43 [Pelomyxa schiedti]|nr:glycosyl family 43 [Pelomyxa schiedti]